MKRGKMPMLKPCTKEWMLYVTPVGGSIYDALCGCRFVHNAGERYWKRCKAHGLTEVIT